MRYAAFLRGINVGGKNSLPMRELVRMFEETGATDVKNYIQSGNIVFSAPASTAKKIGVTIHALIQKAYGFSSPVIMRSQSELAAVVERNPFRHRGDDNVWHVMFLADQPTPARLKMLDTNRSPPDAFAVDGKEVFLLCPNGLAKTKLTNAYFDSKLETVSTVRNWRTLLKLIEMTRDGIQ